MTVRQNILARIKTDLEAILSDGEVLFKSVQCKQPGLPDIESVEYPCAFIYSGPEVRVEDPTRAVIGYETWDWTIMIEAWVKYDSAESILPLIHKALADDYTLGQNAVLCKRIGVDMWVIDPEHDWCSMVIPYAVSYRHPKGVM